jgi:hypothetical protein
LVITYHKSALDPIKISLLLVKSTIFLWVFSRSMPHLLPGLLLFRDLSQLEKAKLLRSAEELKKRQACSEAGEGSSRPKKLQYG